ncbi:MAG: rRNA maturation RNase YbeY [Lachnospiraceae bacterium]|nr:rRNA maturation RNase YbeY [Lachnospiraceae bacterium]
MTLELVNETEKQFDFDFQEIASKVINETLEEEKFPWEAMVEVTLVSAQYIHQLNLEQRGVDRATDVLSFPMLDYEAPGDFSLVEEDSTNFDPETGEVLLGDIVICLDKVEEQAKEYGHSLLREYAFLICHSMLHLLGYDHMVPEEEKVMFEKQEEILNHLGIKRETEGRTQ